MVNNIWVNFFLCGHSVTAFDKMLEILEEKDRYKRRKGGRPSVLSVLDKLVIARELRLVII